MSTQVVNHFDFDLKYYVECFELSKNSPDIYKYCRINSHNIKLYICKILPAIKYFSLTTPKQLFVLDISI